MNSLENLKEVQVVYKDFVKAFSRVNVDVLYKKLKAYGFSGPLLKWFTYV